MYPFFQQAQKEIKGIIDFIIFKGENKDLLGTRILNLYAFRRMYV